MNEDFNPEVAGEFEEEFEEVPQDIGSSNPRAIVEAIVADQELIAMLAEAIASLAVEPEAPMTEEAPAEEPEE